MDSSILPVHLIIALMHTGWQNFLAQQGGIIADDRIAHFGDARRELVAARDATVICDLSHHGLILASGEDAQALLHGQFTNDVTALGDDSAQRNGYCSPKGRLLATFLMWKAKQGFMLQLPRALVAPMQKRLSMFVLRSKVKLEDVSDQWIRIGLAGRAAPAMVQDLFGAVPPQDMKTLHADPGRVIRLSGTRFELICDPENAQRIWAALSKEAAENAVKAGSAVWDWLEIRDGIPTVLPATQEAFVPQMANFELVGGVNFKKGCYPGQEIVARTQYRGILKRRMALAHLDTAETPQPGESVYSAQFGDQAAGQIANAAPSPEGGFDVLVVAQIEGLQGAALHRKNLDGPALQLLPLPYPIPQ